MEDWQKRVVNELDELTERLTKLIVFLSSESEREPGKLSDDALAMLMRQAEVMLEYQRILVMRVRSFDATT